MDETLYGRQPVLEALRAGRRKPARVWVRQSVRPDEDLDETIHLAHELRVPVESVPDTWFHRRLEGAHHQGVALSASAYPYADFDEVLSDGASGAEPAFWLILDHLQDPQNLGAIIRTAEAVGVHGVIIPKDRATGMTPAAVRASAGASEHVRVCLVTNLVRTMEVLKKEEVWLAGLDGSPDAKEYSEADLTGAIGLVLGSEGDGLSRLVRENCDFLIRLPMWGRVTSLNASAAGAIAMYEVRRQRARGK